MKYVIDDHGNVVMGAKSDAVFHKDLFRALGSGSRIAGAGHCRIVNGRVQVYDGSVGFGIESKPEDAEWIEAHLGLPEKHMRPISAATLGNGGRTYDGTNFTINPSASTDAEQVYP